MDKACRDRLNAITERFKICRKALSALGDETRQLIILALLESDYNGVRVEEIARKTHLSRSAVSHHMQVLMGAEMVNKRREGTKNYYYIDAKESQWNTLNELLALVNTGITHMKDNTREDN